MIVDINKNSIRFQTGDANKQSLIVCLFALLVVCLALRFYVLVQEDPPLSADSYSYMTLAQQIIHLDLTEDTGNRTPIYPLFLIALDIDPFRVRLAQMGLGCLITLLIFFIAWRIIHNQVVATFIAACHGLYLKQIRFETDVLTETLATFFIILSLWLFLKAWHRLEIRKGIGWLLPIGIGISAALAGLTRPVFVFLPILFGLLLLGFRLKTKSYAVLLFLFLLPAVILNGGWSLFNFLRLGYFGLTTLTGTNLTNHSGAFIEYAPERYAIIRDIYLDARKKQIEMTGSHVMTIYQAQEQIAQKTGLTRVQLSKELTRMSLELFIDHPLLYGRSVLKSWVDFWNAPKLGSREPGVEPSLNQIGRLARLIYKGQEYFYLLINISFLLLVTIALLVRLILGGRRPNWTRIGWPLYLMGSVVLVTSVLQAFTESGENARYAMPVQSLVACFVLLMVWHIKISWHSEVSQR